MGFLDPKPLTAISAAAAASNPATPLGAAIAALIPPNSLDGGNASSTYTGTFNFDGGSAA